jgi:hypothetical protein
MNKLSLIKLGAGIICALFIGNATALEKHSMTLAASKTEAKDTKAAVLTDNQLAAKVREKFVKEKLFGKDKFADMGIHVTSDKGVVTITGKASSKSDEEKAVKIAKSVDGVKNVESKVVVKEVKKEDKKEVKKEVKKEAKQEVKKADKKTTDKNARDKK